MDNQIESDSDRRIPWAAYLSLVVYLALGAAALALVWSGRVRPAQAADPCGTDGCPALRSVALFEDAPTGRGGRLAITPEEAIAIATEGELGENDFRISDAGGDTLYDAFNAATAYNSAEDEYLVVWSGDSLTIQGNGLSLLADDEFEIFSQRVDAATGEVLGDVYRVSDMGPDGDPDYDAMSPAVAYNSTGNQYLVVWYGDDNSDSVDNEFEIFGQRVNGATGTELGTDFRISVMGPYGDTNYGARSPAVAYNSADDQYLVVWYGDDDGDGAVQGEFEIFGQRVNAATGAEIGFDFRLSDMGPDANQDYAAYIPAVAYDSTKDEYLVVWYGDDNTGGLVEGEYEIFGQLVAASDGAEIGGDFRLSDMGADGNILYGAFNPAVAFNSAEDQYLVVWYGDDDTSVLANGEFEVFGQRVDASNGSELGEDFRISDIGPDGDPSYDATDPAIAYNSADGQYLVIWAGDNDSGGLVEGEFEVFGQRLDAFDGSELGADFRLSDMGPDGNTAYEARFPALSYSSTEGQYLVVWEGDDDSGALIDEEFEIFGQQVDSATGAEIAADVRLSTMGGDTLYDAFNPAVAYNTVENHYLVVWEGEDSSGGLVNGEYEIFGRRVDGASGAVIGGDVRLSDMGPDANPNYEAHDPAVAYDVANNLYLVVWYGDDNTGGLVNGEYEIFGQRVDGTSGVEIGGDFRLSDMGPDGDPSYSAFDPAVAYNSAEDQFLVVWEGDDGSGALANSEYEIFGQQVDAATGAEVGEDLRLSDMGPDGDPLYDASQAAVAYNSTDDQYLVVWEGDDDSDGLLDNEHEIFGQRVDGATGGEIGTDYRLSDMGPDGSPSYGAFTPAVAYNSTEGQYLVVWEGDDGSLGLVDNEYEIFGQRVDGASGAEIGGDLRLSDMGPDGNPDYDARDPTVAFDSLGNQYLVVWEGDDDSDGLAEEELEIYGQRVDGADGAEIGEDFRLSDMGPDGIPEYGGRDPAVAYDGMGNQYLVVWEGDDDRGELVEGEFEIFGQRYSSAPTLSQTAILADAPDPSLPGRPFTVTFSVTAAVGTPTGVVTVTVSDDPGSCRGLLVGGLGDCALTLSGSGTYTLTAAYGGDSTYAPSSDSEPHTVMPIQTQPTVITILSDAPDPSQPGELFTVTFGVTGTLALPTGVVTVTVSDDPGSCTDTLSGGVGGCALALSAPGAYTLTAAYGGDGTLAPSSDTEVHTVVEVNGIRLYLPLVLR